MRTSLLKLCAKLALEKPGRVLICALTATLLAAFFIPNLRVEAGHTAMVDPNEDYQRRFNAFMEDFGSPSLLVVLAEGGTEAHRREVVRRLVDVLPQKEEGAERLCAGTVEENSPGCVRGAMGRIDLNRLARHALWHLPAEDLRAVVQALSRPNLGLKDFASLHGVAALFEKLQASVETGMDGPAPTEDDLEAAKVAMDGLAEFFGAMALQIEGGSQESSLKQRLFDQAKLTGLDTEGFFSADNGAMKIALVRPMDESDEPTVVNPFVRYVRGHAEAVVRDVGEGCATAGGCGETPLRVTLTGIPAMVAEESEVLTWDAFLMSAVAALGILLVFLFGFYSLRQAVLGLTPMLLSVVISLGLVQIIYGTLNILTSGFVGMMLGLGVAFAIHLLSRYNEARTGGGTPDEALYAALLGAGPGIMTGSFTTIGAFLALIACDFKAFAELGVITSIGLTVSMLTTLTVLPAMLSHPKLRNLREIPPSSRKLAHVFRELGRIPSVVTRHPKTVLLLSAITTVGLLLGVHRITWSYDYLEMLPEGLPSVEGMKKITDSPDFSTEMLAVEADSVEGAALFAEALSALPSVARVESLATYLPDDQEVKRGILKELEPLLAELPSPPSPSEVDVAAIGAGVQDLSDTLEDAKFEARRGDDAQKKLFDAPLEALKRVAQALENTPEKEALPRLRAMQEDLLGVRDSALAVVRASVEAKSITLESILEELPTELAGRLYHEGRFAVYAYPAKSIWDKSNLGELIREVRTVDPEATGFPVQHYEVNSAVEAGFKEASVLVVIALLILVFLDFRDLRYTVLAMFPLAMGLAWTWGLFSLASMHYTSANIIAFPLILGIAIDSGVHILHRYKQEHGEKVAEIIRYTGKAVLLSGFTTMAGFGALTTASHRGAQSIGVVLLMGTSTGLLTAIIVLPALLAVARVRAPGPMASTPPAEEQ